MKRKTDSKRTEGNGQAVGRRGFIKGIAASAAVGVLTSGKSAVAEELPKQFPRSTGVLAQSPAVMIWRRVSSLQNTKAFVETAMPMKPLGQDPISIMYDAGQALIGYAIPEVPASKEPAIAGVTTTPCSGASFTEFAIQPDPAFALVFAAPNFESATARLSELSRVPPMHVEDASGRTLSFIDPDGNYYRFHAPSEVALRATPKPTTVGFAGAEGSGHQLLGIDLLVSDLYKSSQFYSEVLGLQRIPAEAGVVKFDMGTMILTLRREPTAMLVAFLKKSGRLAGDWIVFHSDDIRKTSAALTERGIKFPYGIESSLIGKVGYFNDPDGHSLSLWQPSGKTKMIDFTSTLNRILKQNRPQS